MLVNQFYLSILSLVLTFVIDFFFFRIVRPPGSTPFYSSAASDLYKSQISTRLWHETARLILRDVVNAPTGFEQLATPTAKPSKSLHRMLSPTGNLSMDNLAAVFWAIRDRLQVNFEAHTVAV